MDYKLVAVDMDGTLLTPELEISRDTVETVRKVIQKGVIFTLSTGRMYLAALPFAKLLELDVPVITCNGAVTKCSRTGNVIDIKVIPENYLWEVINYCRDESLSASIYSDDNIFMEKGSRNMGIHERLDFAEPILVDGFKALADSTVIKIMCSSSDPYALEYKTRKLYEMYKDKLTFYFSLPYFVEIVNKDANKRNALEIIAAKFNIKREEIIAIGDNFNDMDMIMYAGLGVAMGNSPQYLKDAADFVTHSNDEDGVRYVLEKFILDQG